jgi:FtsZ-binding cell division protein ZapB
VPKSGNKKPRTMVETQEHIERLRQKIGVLLKLWQTLRKENERLQKENALLRQQEDAYQDTIARLDQQVEALRLTGTTALSEPERKSMEKTITGYVREIDRCIALLTE